jgi:hypothetical protein
MLPDSTVMYPGHGELTEIGFEKQENTRIAETGGAWGGA